MTYHRCTPVEKVNKTVHSAEMFGEDGVLELDVECVEEWGRAIYRTKGRVDIHQHTGHQDELLNPFPMHVDDG